MNRITGLVIALVVGGLLVGGLLIPSIEAIQTDIGDEIKITNNSAIVLREIEDGDVLKLTRTVSDGSGTDVWTLNDETLTSVSGGALAWNVGLISDAWYVQINSSSGSSGTTYNMTQTTPQALYYGGGAADGTYTTTWAASEGKITFTNHLGTSVAVNYTWGYVVCNLEEGDYYSAETGGVGICKKANDLILCGAYTSGELDTMYSYVNGVNYVSNPAYTMTVNADLTKHAGTTDIYDITTSVVMSDGANEETFTPYRVFLPYEVTGHASSGMYYVMFGVISILGIVALVVVAANGIRNKY